MRNAVIGSTVVHVGLLIALFVMRVSANMIVAGPDVVDVALIEPSTLRMPAPTPAPVQREPDPVKERLTPTEDVGVKVSEPPKKKKPEPEPEKPPEPAQDLPSPALPYVAVGPSGLSGALSVDAANFEFTYYLVIVRNRIAQNWTPPAGLVTGGAPVKGVVYFKIGRTGTIGGIRIETQSGYAFFDRSALRAIQLSNPMPPLPIGFPGSDLGVHFGFQYASP